MSAGCMARTQRAPRRAQILRGKASSAGNPIWNGRIESGRKLTDGAPLPDCGSGLAIGVRGFRPGVTMVPAWPRAWI